MASEAMPETIMEYRFICVNGLKLDLLVQYGALYDSERIDGSARKMTTTVPPAWAGFKEGRAISGEQPISTPYSRILISQIEPEDGTELFCSRLFLLE